MKAGTEEISSFYMVHCTLLQIFEKNAIRLENITNMYFGEILKQRYNINKNDGRV